MGPETLTFKCKGQVIDKPKGPKENKIGEPLYMYSRKGFSIISTEEVLGTSLVVQRLRLYASNVEGTGSIRVRELRSHMPPRHSRKISKYKNKMHTQFILKISEKKKKGSYKHTMKTVIPSGKNGQRTRIPIHLQPTSISNCLRSPNEMLKRHLFTLPKSA